MASQQVENLLRPPVEWWVTGIGSSIALLLHYKSSYFLISDSTSNWLVITLLFLSYKRYWQGWKVVKYQRHLRQLPYYTIKSQKIPVNHQQLFLGKGFRWEMVHTQRLYYTELNNKYYLKQHPIYYLIRFVEKHVKQSRYATLRRCAIFLSSQHILNPAKPLAPVGGNVALHGIELFERNVFMSLSERVGHTLILGTTRVGKTRLLELLVSQDIKRQECVIVFDPKGDIDLLRRIVYEAHLSGREEDVIIFHLGFPEVSARYNPVGHFARVTEVANRIANQLPGSGESAAFKEFAWRFVNIIAKALVAIGRKPDYQHIQRYIVNIEPLLIDYCEWWLPTINRNWRLEVQEREKALDPQHLPFHLRARSPYLIALVNYIKELPHYDAVIDGLCSAFNYDKTYFDKITASLLPLIEKLTSGKTADLLSPDYADLNDERPIFDWLQVIRGKKIVYVGLDALSDATVAAAVGNSMFADLCSIAGQLYKYGVESKTDGQLTKTLNVVNVHADEFNELIGEEFVPLANKSGGSGFRLSAYTQTWSDVEARLGNKAKAGQVGGNFNTLICLRVLEEETARLLTSKLSQKVTVPVLQSASSVSHSGIGADYNVNNEDRIVNIEVPMLSTRDLIQLPKGQAFCLLEGGQLWKIRIPLSSDDMKMVPFSVNEIVDFLSSDGR